jgi:hypothetical protein
MISEKHSNQDKKNKMSWLHSIYVCTILVVKPVRVLDQYADGNVILKHI